ncbi:preprotein translocase subunit SecE [Ignatzschineria sp. RMDPL8A]|uniref:preprotein translocase subunit SecE n=1 Tax=Ignatzschineria sp. RMDPL8A TaxID=2999236 RepID=UPI00169F2003|nr:preprotein translocase subunit SecE [Ignatzschineria sp. RMDPL8A]MDG9729322.1 preprotein translocase subunit SecE [Ignatzschineria sp. RMDPL8A]NLD09138.1 preprotein translocase subunit SecE [Xanthomonadaceae bacterium]
MSSKRKAKAEAVAKRVAAEEKATNSNKMIVTLAIVVGVVGLVGYYYLTGMSGKSLLMKMGLPEYMVGKVESSTILGSAVLIVCMAAAAGMVFLSQTGRNFVTFVKEARIELRRVFWPSMDETKKTTLIVLIVMAVVLMFLMIVDWLLRVLISLFLSFS